MEHHGAALQKLKKNPTLVQALKEDYLQADLHPAVKSILNFAVMLTRSPWEVTDADVSQLRQEGLDDKGILEVCHVVSYFNFVNRMASGLGVQLEEGGS